MKVFKKALQHLFTTFGIHMSLLLLYFSTVDNPATDWFVAVTTLLLSVIFSLWICEDKKRSDNNAEMDKR